MNNFVIDTPDNFWQIRWLDKYMEGHEGFIAGGCFKNILSGERVKDIDIFFERLMFRHLPSPRRGIGPVLRAARPSRGTWSSPVASRAPATSTSETWFGR